VASDLPLLAVGPALLAALAAALLHLGQPARAGRALANWRTSWLSREILSALLFGAGWAGALVLARALEPAAAVADLSHCAVALLGLGLVYAMARVYRLRTVPAWNTPRTFRAFLLTTLVLGALATAALQDVARGGGRSAALLLLLLAAATIATFFRLRFYRRYARSGL
jgi:DMSO reductase anchor subunit